MTRAATALAAALMISACGPPKTVAITPGSPLGDPVQQLKLNLTAVFDAGQFERSFWSVLVRRADADTDVYSLNAGKLMMPGSAMKIVTLAVAAEVL